MICHTKSPPARSALNFNATSHSLGQASREPDHGLAGKSWYTRYHRDVDVVSSELSGNAKYVMWIVCRCGNTTIHHNYNFLYHLGVVICDGYEDLCTIPNWDLPTALYHWDYCQLVPISWSRYIHLYAILSFGDCEVECPLDKRLETEVCMFFPMSAWNCSHLELGRSWC